MNFIIRRPFKATHQKQAFCFLELAPAEWKARRKLLRLPFVSPLWPAVLRAVAAEQQSGHTSGCK